MAQPEASSSLLAKEIEEHITQVQECGNVVEPGSIVVFPVDQFEKILASGNYKTVKIVHFTRHGEGTHNLKVKEIGYACQCTTSSPVGPCPYKNEELLDARLTAKGRAEAKINNEYITNNNIVIECACTSPLSRAIETGLISIEGERLKNIPFYSADFMREQSGNHICDKRRPKVELERDFPRIDFSSLEEFDTYYDPDVREEKSKLAARCLRTIRYIQDLPFTNIAFFGHSGFLCTLFGSIFGTSARDTWFNTGEMRSLTVAWK